MEELKKLQEEKDKLIKAYLEMCIKKNSPPLKKFISEIEKELLIQVLKITSGNQKIASHLLGIKPNTLNVKLKRYNINSRYKKFL